MSSAGSRWDASAAPQESDSNSRNLVSAQDPDKIIVPKFWKSRSRREFVCVQIFKWHDIPLLDVRVFVDEAGISKPSKKGVCISIRKADELIDALRKASAKAEALGWIKA